MCKVSVLSSILVIFFGNASADFVPMFPFISMIFSILRVLPQPASTCSKLTIETLEQVVKYVQS